MSIELLYFDKGEWENGKLIFTCKRDPNLFLIARTDYNLYVPQDAEFTDDELLEAMRIGSVFLGIRDRQKK